MFYTGAEELIEHLHGIPRGPLCLVAHLCDADDAEHADDRQRKAHQATKCTDDRRVPEGKNNLTQIISGDLNLFYDF